MSGSYGSGSSTNYSSSGFGGGSGGYGGGSSSNNESGRSHGYSSMGSPVGGNERSRTLQPAADENPFEATRKRIEQLRSNNLPTSPSSKAEQPPPSSSSYQSSEQPTPVPGSIDMDASPNLFPGE